MIEHLARKDIAVQIMQMNRRIYFLLLFLLGMFATGCTHHQTFTGRIVSPEATWTSKKYHMFVHESRRTDDNVLLFMGSSRAIGPWSVLVEVEVDGPKAWLILGKYADPMSEKVAFEKWGSTPKKYIMFQESVWGRRHCEEVMLGCAPSERATVAESLNGVRAIAGTISVMHFSNSKNFKVDLDAHSLDEEWIVKGVFVSDIEYHLGRSVSEFASLGLFVPAMLINAVQRAVDPDTPLMTMP